MDAPKHTPTPWKYEPSDRGDDSVGIGPAPAFVYVEAPEDSTSGETVKICELHEPMYCVSPDSNNEYDDGIRQVGWAGANAELIVRAVNSHAELLAALKATLAAWLEEANQGDGIMEQHAPALDAARAAIAKAEGK